MNVAEEGEQGPPGSVWAQLLWSDRAATNIASGQFRIELGCRIPALTASKAQC